MPDPTDTDTDGGYRYTSWALNPHGHRPFPARIEVTFFGDRNTPLVLDTPTCGLCDQYLGALDFDTATNTATVTTACPIPDGLTTTITLAVPSGKIIVTDDLHPIYTVSPHIHPATPDYNSTLGQAHATALMAAQGCAFGPLLDTSPGLYRTGLDTYVIANPAWIDDDEDRPSLPHDTLLAEICTDLWAYSIADYEHWISRGGDPTTLGATTTIVDIRPGTYRFVHHTGVTGFDHHSAEETIYATITRLPETTGTGADTVVDQLEELAVTLGSTTADNRGEVRARLHALLQHHDPHTVAAQLYEQAKPAPAYYLP